MGGFIKKDKDKKGLYSMQYDINKEKRISVMPFLLRIGHYYSIHKHFHNFKMYVLKVCCLKATLYHNGQI